MRLADIVADSIVDGPGLRLTVFTQGCPHACPACHNPETHNPKGGEDYPLEALIAKLSQNQLTEGLTLSGGEPFLQAEECARLAQAAHKLGFSVWTYTGYQYEVLQSAGREEWDFLLAQTDVLVDGPYLDAQREYALRFRGSRNQRLIDLKQSRVKGKVVLWKEREDTLAHFMVPES